jgi:hypothetical protein
MDFESSAAVEAPLLDANERKRERGRGMTGKSHAGMGSMDLEQSRWSSGLSRFYGGE